MNVQNAGVVVYEVRIDFTTPPPPSVKLGMSATVDIVTTQRQNVLLIPSRVIKIDDQNNSTVVRSWSTTRGETRIIKLGLTDGVNTEVPGGLTENDILVITRAATESLGMFGQ